MVDIAHEAFREGLARALNEDEAFARETRWFDGSILLEVDAGQCWLKVYRGKVIDALDFTPPLGYTFKISGSSDTWQLFTSGQRQFVDLITPGSRYFSNSEEVLQANGFAPPAIRIEGNTMEANRIHEALYPLSDCIAATAN